MSEVWGFISPETSDFIGVTEDGMRRRWTLPAFDSCGVSGGDGRFVCARPKGHGGLHTDNDNMKDWERTLVSPLDVGEDQVAIALLAWYDHTHGNSFGHDHHCPVRWNENPFDPSQDSDACTCGWAEVVRADARRGQLWTPAPEVVTSVPMEGADG